MIKDVKPRLLFISLLVAVLVAFPFRIYPQENKYDLVSQNIVIAGIYGGGGLSSGVYTHDYVVLFNRGDTPVDVSGWSTQYASDSGTNWLVTPIPNAVIGPGRYFLIQYGSSGANGSALPTPDLIAPFVPEGFIPNISSRDGKLAVVNHSNKLPAEICPTGGGVVDFVGFGTAANCSEGTPTPNLNPSSAANRLSGGCVDTDNNREDLPIGTPVPLNSSEAANPCGLGATIQAGGAAEPANIAPGAPVLFSVQVIPATSPPSTGISVTADLSQIGGSNAQQFNDEGNNGDAAPGDDIYSFRAVIPTNEQGGPRTIMASVTDAQSRNAGVVINITINAPLADENPLILGNPSDATTSIADEDNYLLNKPQYSLSYNRFNATANWVAWRLDAGWIGLVPRQNDFRQDVTLPALWYRVIPEDYNASGYNRGHICPSGDRTNTIADNSATFLMTNIVPQLTESNQGPWLDFENYLRTLAAAGKEIYVFSGVSGNAGTIAGGKITVPVFLWKVALILPNGDDDLGRVNKTTRTIAVMIPNQLPLDQNSLWREYRRTVDQVEVLTGNDFFSEVAKNTQEMIERRRDTL